MLDKDVVLTPIGAANQTISSLLKTMAQEQTVMEREMAGEGRRAIDECSRGAEEAVRDVPEAADVSSVAKQVDVNVELCARRRSCMYGMQI